LSWKSFVILAATLAFSGSLLAQDKQSTPYLGIWELDLAKTVNYPQQSQMIINLPAPGGGFISTRATIGKDNQSSTEVHPVVFDGKPHATTGNNLQEFSYRIIDPYSYERTSARNGNMQSTKVSQDGKTMTVTQAGGIVRIYNKTFTVRMN
jgi:hypothetical protein